MSASHSSDSQKLVRPDAETIAYRARSGNGQKGVNGQENIGVVWLGGFKSDMVGSKAGALDDWAVNTQRHFVRFDYFGHGESSGAFVDGTIGRWLDDALAVLDAIAQGPVVLVGSSMGGWIALLAALARPDRVRGIALVAPAPDFTEDLMWQRASEETKQILLSGEIYAEPSEYDDEPYEISMGLIEEARRHLLLRSPIEVQCPVRILHGMADVDVPWQRSLMLVEQLATSDVTVNFIKDADHRMSDDQNIARLVSMVADLCRSVE